MWCTHQRFKFSSYNSLLDEPSYEPISERPLLTTLSQIQFTHTADQIDEIINDQIVSTRYGGYHRFLVRRKGLPDLRIPRLIGRSSNGWMLIVWALWEPMRPALDKVEFFSTLGEWWRHHFRIAVLHQKTLLHPINLIWLELEDSSLVRLVILVLFLFFIVFWIFNLLLVSHRLWWDFSIDVGLFKANTVYCFPQFWIN